MDYIFVGENVLGVYIKGKVCLSDLLQIYIYIYICIYINIHTYTHYINIYIHYIYIYIIKWGKKQQYDFHGLVMVVQGQQWYE